MTRKSCRQDTMISCCSEKEHAPPPPAPRQGDSYWKGRRHWLEIVRRIPKRYQDLVLRAWLESFSISKRKNTTLTRLSSLGDAAKSFRCGSKTTFLTPEKYDERPLSFLYRTSPLGDHALLRQDQDRDHNHSQDLDSRYLPTGIFYVEI